jgi:hypothetical protein
LEDILTNETDIYGKLGRDWWERNGAEVGATPQQIKFAAARHNGATRAKAAELANYSGNREQLRSAGSRVDNTPVVKDLITLAEAAEAGVGDTTVTPVEIKRKLSRIIRGPDGALALKASELLLKIDSTVTASFDTSKTDPAEHVLVTVLLCTREGGYPPELFIATWAMVAIPEHAWWCPLLRQMVPYLKQNLPAIWSIARRHLAQWRPDDLTALENGPVLTADQIFDIAAKTAGPLLTVIDGSGDIEARKNAFEDLRKIGLIEPAGAPHAA